MDTSIAIQSLYDSVLEKKNVTKNIPSFMDMAPSSLRDLSPSCFKPQVVCIGPLHRKDENLKRFEVRKAAFVNNLFSRDSSPKQTLTTCVEKVASMIEKIRGCYADVESWENTELTIMMVMDACFILEFCFSLLKGFVDRMWGDNRIPFDLMLLENQIPFFVLKNVYECLPFLYGDRTLTQVIHPLLTSTSILGTEVDVDRHRDTDYDHLLDCLYHCYLPTTKIRSSFPHFTTLSAVQLELAGVSITPIKDAEWPMAMEWKMPWYHYLGVLFFWLKPTLRIPTLNIDDDTELVLRNLIAYEVLYMHDGYLTSYVMAMDMLIDTHEDFAKLVASKVMVNHIGSNEEAANMMKRICKEVRKEVLVEDFYYTDQWNRLYEYCERSGTKHIMIMKLLYVNPLDPERYFKSPWGVIGLYAAIIIFILTWVQAIFTVKSFYK